MYRRLVSKVINRLKIELRCYEDPFPNLSSKVLTVRTLTNLKTAMGWTNTPILDGEHLHQFQYLEDLNDRRVRDAEIVGTVCCNGDPKILLEIGTAHGHTTALMAQNASQGMIHTINIPPEDIQNGGVNVTFAPALEEIGYFYKEKGLQNIRQILANTKNWEPDFGPIDVAFIDGCHDSEFIYSDTKLVLSKCHPGSIIMWHDFNPSLTKIYSWIDQVCLGVERLYAEGLLEGKIFHLQDSWVGLYVVPEKR